MKVCIAPIVFLLLNTFDSAWAQGNEFDLTPILKSRSEFSDRALTRKCKDTGVLRDALCQGNEGRIRLSSASIRTAGNLHAKMVLRQRNKHKPFPWWTAYDSSSNITIRFEITPTCEVVDKSIDGESAYLHLANAILPAFGKRLEDYLFESDDLPFCAKAK